MNDWLTSQNRKRHQRAINKLMRDLNKNIERDDLWRGRFRVSQVAAHFVPYEDGSGAELWVCLRFVDRLTGKYEEALETVNHWRMWHGNHLFWKMNSFITEVSDVWESDPKPYSQEYKEMTNKYVKEGWPF